MSLNRNAPEWLYFMGAIDAKITSYRMALESEGTSTEDMLRARAKLRALLTLKKDAEEHDNDDA